MREFNSTNNESISLNSTVQFFTPPSPRSNRARELHCSARPRKRLFSSGGEGCNDQEQNHAELEHILNDPVLIRNLFNEESWTPVEGQFSAESSGSYRAPVKDQVPEESNGCPYWAPAEDHIPAESNDSYSLHNQAENRYSCVPSRVPYNFKGTHVNYSESMCGPSCLPYNLEGTQQNSESRNFDTLEPPGMPYNLEGVHQSSESRHDNDLDSTWSPSYNLEVSQQNSESRNYDGLEPPMMPYNLEDIQNNSENDRAREIHHSVRSRRRLFSSGGERSNDQEQNHAELEHILNDPVLIRNLFNEESWAPVEGQFSAESGGSYRAPVEDQVPEESNGCPYWAPAEDHIPAESNDLYSLHNQAENRYSRVPSPVPYSGSWSDDDDFDGRYFDTSSWKPDTISCQQWRVLEAISQGKSVFVTGSAGTGKSYLLEFAKRVLVELYDPLSVFVTASTGIAACALKGRTLHSFAGVGLGDKPAPVLASSISYRENQEAYKRWESARALIIDEISMIDGELFDKLDFIARDIRRNGKVFGGLQLVVTGDFFQLPPVKPANPRKQFAFEAKCWNNCFDMQIELKEVFRQADREFIGMLNEIRKGWCSLNTKVRLSNCTGPLSWTHGIAPTRLFPTKFDVRRENDMELKALNKEIIPFTARDIGPEKHLLDNGVAPKVLYLCEGAQVVLIWNLDVEIGLVNGARGVVTGFTWSEMREARDVSPKGLWPVVRFDCLETAQVLRPAEWEIHEGKIVVASRRQVPLILAWALSVHKCQGMTLDRVQTNLSKAFEYGMVYVALSRVRNLEGLQLNGFDPSKIKAHPKVIKFYEKFTEKNDDSGNHTGHF